MFTRYPHDAVLKWYTEPTPDPVTGIKTEGQPTNKPVKCRFEPVGKADYQAMNGHVELHYGYKVFLPLQSFDIPENATITRGTIEMTIARIDPMQNNVVLRL